MRSNQFWIGCLVAVFLLVGRWTPDRLAGGSGEALFCWEPRFWLVLVIAFGTLVVASQESRSHTSVRTFVPLAMLVFLAYTVTTICWTIDVDLALDKCYEAVLLFVLVGCLSVCCRFCGFDQLRFGFWLTFVALATLMALSATLSFGSDRLAVFGGGPIVFGRNMGLMLLGLLYLRSRLPRLGTAVWVPIAALASLLIAMSGSRGALLAAVVGGLTYVLIDRLTWSRKLVLVGVAGGLVLLMLDQTTLGRRAQETFRYRVMKLTVEDQYTSGRDDLYHGALELAQENPILGCGLAGFRAVWGTYPHNIFLEVFAESGVVGGALLLGLLVTAAFSLKRNWRCVDRATLAAFCHIFVAAQFSGDLFDSRGVFVLLILAAVPLESDGSRNVCRAASQLGSTLAGRRMRPRPRPIQPVAMGRPKQVEPSSNRHRSESFYPS
jgi:O-antigen ligase